MQESVAHLSVKPSVELLTSDDPELRSELLHKVGQQLAKKDSLQRVPHLLALLPLHHLPQYAQLPVPCLCLRQQQPVLHLLQRVHERGRYQQGRGQGQAVSEVAHSECFFTMLV